MRNVPSGAVASSRRSVRVHCARDDERSVGGEYDEDDAMAMGERGDGEQGMAGNAEPDGDEERAPNVGELPRRGRWRGPESSSTSSE